MSEPTIAEIAREHREWRQSRPTYDFQEDEDFVARVNSAVERATAAKQKECDNLFLLVKDGCHDESEIQKLCKPIIGQIAIDDGYGCTPIVDCVEKTIAQLREQNAALEADVATMVNESARQSQQLLAALERNAALAKDIKLREHQAEAWLHVATECVMLGADCDLAGRNACEQIITFIKTLREQNAALLRLFRELVDAHYGIAYHHIGDGDGIDEKTANEIRMALDKENK